MPLTAAWIVRDEERCLARSLRSMAPYADEILVVDTGSVDASVDIAVACGARVLEREWQGSFAAARNAALEAARHPWVAFVDADEWLIDGGERLRAFAQSPCDRVGLVDIVSHYELDGRPVSSVTVLDRVLPSTLRYIGRVHERPVHDLPAARLAVTFHHDGYAPAVAAGKRGRNEPLLLAELNDRPDDPYVLYQLGKEWELDERFAQAADAYCRACGGAPLDAPWRHPLVVRLLYVLKRLGDFSAALALFDAEQDRYAESPDFWFTAGDLFLDMAMAVSGERQGEGEEMLDVIEASWLRALEIGDRPDLPGSVQGRGSSLVRHNLETFYQLTGRVVRSRGFDTHFTGNTQIRG